MHYLPLPESARRPIPFRWIFPLGQLFFCALLVATVTLAPMYLPGVFRSRALESIAALNLPAGLIQIPIDASRASKQEWMPIEMDLFLWRAITWPVIGMLFWWIAGRAVEALVSIRYRQLTPRVGWMETIVGFLVMAAGATIFLGLLFGLPPSDAKDNGLLRRFVAGAGLWALLGALSVIARFRQCRLRKRHSNSHPIAAQVGQ